MSEKEYRDIFKGQRKGSLFPETAPHVQWLRLVLHLSLIYLTETELQYQTWPVDKRGAVSGEQKVMQPL